MTYIFAVFLEGKPQTPQKEEKNNQVVLYILLNVLSNIIKNTAINNGINLRNFAHEYIYSRSRAKKKLHNYMSLEVFHWW